MIENKIYLSFILAFRDDNYGEDLLGRTNDWIQHLVKGLGEFAASCEVVIVNWNPPKLESNIEDILDLKFPLKYKIITFTNSEHNKFPGHKERPMLDYVARHEGIKNASGRYVCISNQDIYFSFQIFAFIINQNLDSSYFYRADRCDVEKNISGFEDIVASGDCLRAQVIHRRHNFELELSVTNDPNNKNKRPICSRAEKLNESFGEVSEGFKDWLINYQSIKEMKSLKITDFLSQTGLHTNASGDFIIAPKNIMLDFEVIPRTALFYMHLDTYIIINLWMAGLKQFLFEHPMHIFHIFHSTEERLSRQELFDWSEHEVILKGLLFGILKLNSTLATLKENKEINSSERKSFYD